MKTLFQPHRDWIMATFGDSGKQLITDMEADLNANRGLDEETRMKMLYKTFGMSAPTPPQPKREDK